MHFGGTEQDQVKYLIDDLSTNRKIELEEFKCERDLGVNISNDLR